LESVPKIATHSSKDGWEKYTECPLNIKRSLNSLNCNSTRNHHKRCGPVKWQAYY